MHWLARFGPVLLALTISTPRLGAAASEVLDGLSFAEDPHMLFVPVEEIASALGWEMQKRVEVDLANQRLRAYQGARLVLESHISTGREGKKTPPGEFKAGPVKSPMHRSRLYHNAPMPWSVQVHENIFIHGFQKVPRHPSSHGCIRLPLTGANPAKWFYDWIDIGTPVSIRGHWPAATVRVEKPALFARPFIQKVVIAIVTTIACVMIILLVRRGRGKV